MKYSERISSLSPSATLQLSAKAKELKRAGEDIVSLSAGQPDFDTPLPIAEAGIQAVREGHTGYTASTGIPELKMAVAEKYSDKHGLEWTPENVVVGCGAKHCLSNLMLSAVNPGDGVLLPRPYWVSYPEMVKAAGGRPVYPRTGRIEPEDVKRAFRDGAVGMLLNFPSNPEGYVPSRQEMKSIAEAVAETGMWVISDDIYEDLCYLETGVPHILDFRPELKDRTAVVSGVSKTFAMTGWRIGYFLADRRWAKTAGTFQAHSTSNPCSVSQWAALAAVEGRAEGERTKMLESFSRRRDLICSLLSEDKFVQFTVPDGAFYVFLRVNTAAEPDSALLCSQLLEEEGLAVIPGSAFGAEGHIRLSFAASEENIREGVRRLMRFLHRRYDT
ncbi:MAG: aminotransferase class I/II-fold pyridoxal phosphate-dependent enzyme [Candidatus Aegiribacteria sp.]|nr:aminotransferase class I/II-fold pyridoxal phosphate-dependent enzyme [Candidatus Aegiribacteria sp.]MBD3294383.1 aminotransferase class I/II-fold pyridoxal phosphate-dependent enzyme [Candidatus Fermentibacteria bacterium]